MRSLVTFLLLMSLKGASRLFYRMESQWVGEVPENRWRGYRIIAILNHTSLFEVLYAGVAPTSLLWRIARHAVVPVADVTMNRPIAGRFYSLIARHVVPISRQRDHTWQQVVSKIDDPKAIVAILPEGRMMRRDGLDKDGKPMSVRGGIADLLTAMPEGRILLAYSGGLHHIHAPGDRFPRLFKTISMRFEGLDIPTYREQMLALAGERGFKRAVAADLERRRDRYCWPDPSRRPRPAASAGDETPSPPPPALGEAGDR